MKNILVGDLVQIEAFNQRCNLVTSGAIGLDNIITHVTIMEAPDFYEWVTGGEFVLTTWYAFSVNPSIQVEAFRKLAKNISAIGIKTGRFIDKIPQEIIEIAEENNVAVFEVITKSKFREIVQIVSSEIQDYQTNLLVDVGEYYQSLMQLSISSDDVLPLLDALYRRIHSSCFCVNSKHEILAYKLDRQTSKSEIVRCTEWLRNVGDKMPEKGIGYVRLDNINIFRCQGRIGDLGMLVIISEAALSERTYLMCQQTAAFISLKLRDNYESRQKEIANLWSRFLSGKYKDNLHELDVELKQHGLRGADGYTLLILNNRDECYKMASSIGSTVSSMLSFAYADKIILLLAGKKYACKSTPWLETLERILNLDNKSDLLVIAPPIKNINSLLESYTIAKDTYKFLRRYNFSGIRFSNDYVLMSMLMKNIDTAEYKYLQKHIIMPLQQYDLKQNSELLRTLVMAVFSNTLETAAKKLHIHINTLRYRLNKVEELTGKNFFDVNDRYAIMVACLLFKKNK